MIKKRSSLNVDCSKCLVKHLCLTRDLSAEEVGYVNDNLANIMVLKKGEHAFHAKDPMKNLYAVHSGSCKEYWVDADGNECVNNFYLQGDIVGLESIPIKQHFFSLVALQDTSLCIVPLNSILELMHKFPSVLSRILNIASYKMQNDQHIKLSTNANRRVADFILNILYRLQERQIYKTHITLPMTQLDISNCLGMAHETVNRVLKKLNQEKIITLENKMIHIIDVKRLEALGTPLRRFGQV